MYKCPQNLDISGITEIINLTYHFFTYWDTKWWRSPTIRPSGSGSLWISPWWRRRYVPPKPRFLREPRDFIISQKTAFFLLSSCLQSSHSLAQSVHRRWFRARRTGFNFLQEQDLSVLSSIQAGSGPPWAPYTVGTAGCSAWVKRRGCAVTAHPNLVSKSRTVELYLNFPIRPDCSTTIKQDKLRGV
jgi:hypothetical protein